MTKIGILLQKNCHKCYNGKKYGGELCYIWGGELLSCRVAELLGEKVFAGRRIINNKQDG